MSTSNNVIYYQLTDGTSELTRIRQNIMCKNTSYPELEQWLKEKGDANLVIISYDENEGEYYSDPIKLSKYIAKKEDKKKKRKEAFAEYKKELRNTNNVKGI